MNLMNNVSPTVSRKNSLSDGFSGVIKESYEFFADQGINMMADVKDILAEDTLFTNYSAHLCENLDADDAAQLNQILENARVSMLNESTISGISPLAGLTMPTIRKLWLKIAMKNAVPTEAAKIPTFTISYFKPYIKEADGTKRYLPEDLRTKDTRERIATKKALTDKYLVVPTVDGKATEMTETRQDVGGVSVLKKVEATSTTENILTLSGVIPTSSESIDPIFYIESVVLETKADSTGSAGDAVIEEIKVDIKLSHEGKLYGVVKSKDGSVTDTLLGNLDLVTGELELVSVKGLVKAAKIKGYISSETNRNSQSVGYDIDRKNITIGTGAHINAPLPIEVVQDSMALYNVDATLEVVDIMSNVVAQKLEYEIVDFFDQSFDRTANKADFIGQFDVKPASGFAGSPLMWREEIKRVIDYKATQLKEYSAFTNGYFVIYGNPLDMQIIPNVAWTFNHTADEKGGVAVDYDIGAYSGSHKYNLVSTFHVPQGRIHMFFVPESDKYMTYKYYPYTFNIEKGYLDPQNPHVPSIMMTKRHTIEEFMPVAAVIDILHNDGAIIEKYTL